MTTLSADNRLVYKTLRRITTLPSLATCVFLLLSRLLVVTSTVAVKGTVGLAGTHPFRNSRVGAVLEDNLYC